MFHECFDEASVQNGFNNSYGDSRWTPSPSPRLSSVCSTGGSGGPWNAYDRIRSAWESGQATELLASTLSALVFKNECLSSCYIFDADGLFRKFGTEDVDWASLSFALWPSELPLGFLLFWLDSREVWSISARSAPEIVGVRSALCYAKQNTGVLPIAARHGPGGDWEFANVFVSGPCAITNWHRHRSITRVSNRLIACLVASFRHVAFWRRES